MLPSATAIKGTTITIVIFLIFLISLFKSWYFATFCFSLSLTPIWSGTATSKIMHFLSPLLITITLSTLASFQWSRWIFLFQSIFTLSVSTTPSRKCLYHLSAHFSLCFPHLCQCTSLATLPCLCLYSPCAIFLHSLCDIQFHLSLHKLQSGGSICKSGA